MTGVYLVLQGQFTVGMILAFQGYLSQFMAPASTLTSVMQTLQEMRTDMERIEDVMRYPDDPASPRLRSTAPHRARSSRAPCIWRA